MGIKNLTKFLKERYGSVYTRSTIDKYQMKKIAIDIYGIIYRYKALSAGKKSWLDYFIYMVSAFKKNMIHPFFVFDGKPPPEKTGTLKQRASDRQKIEDKYLLLSTAIEKYHCTGEIDPILEEENNKLTKTETVKSLICPKKIDIFALERRRDALSSQCDKVTMEDLIILKELLTVFGFPYMVAPSEAETTCAHLVMSKQCDVMLTNDTDSLVYGVQNVIFDFNPYTNVTTEVNLDYLLDQLGLEFEEFRDFCIMCGNDYNKNIDGIGPVKSFDLIKQYGCIENIGKEKPNLDVSTLAYENTRRLFTLPETCDIKVPYCSIPDLNKVQQFMFKINSKVKFETVKNIFTPIEIQFDELSIEETSTDPSKISNHPVDSACAVNT